MRRKNKNRIMEITKWLLFKPTFTSNIAFFEVVGIDEGAEIVNTKAYPKEGTPFDDSIELETLKMAFEIGEYDIIDKCLEKTEEFKTYTPLNAYPIVNYLGADGYEQKALINGSMCGRCKHRFGGSPNQKRYCANHHCDEICMRFKLDR